MFDAKAFYEKENKAIAAEYAENIGAVEALVVSAGKKYEDYIKTVGNFILKCVQLETQLCDAYFEGKDFETLMVVNRAIFGDIQKEAYNTSFANPVFAVAKYGREIGQILSFVYAEVLDIGRLIYQHRIAAINRKIKLFLSAMILLGTDEGVDGLKGAVLVYAYQDLTERYEAEIVQDNDVDYAFWRDIVEKADLSDLRYLFRFGLYIGENEVKTAEYLFRLPQEKIDAMAKTMTDGYFRGFERGKKSLAGKTYTVMFYQVGFERVVRAAIGQFAQKGMAVTFRQSRIESTAANRQFAYDHKFDHALYLDSAFAEAAAKSYRVAHDNQKRVLAEMSGVVWLKAFGEAPFMPENKEEALKLTEQQRKVDVKLSTDMQQIRNEYIDQKIFSFTIIAYPLPEIGEAYADIFDATIAVNNLDSDVYETIQQKMIDVLDESEAVHVKGKGENQTDITVALAKLSDPEKETLFENCVADVNIPVGEVFTSPRLAGTNGILHVGEVYLRGLLFKNLKLTFTDGFITDYICTNFKDADENRQYIRDNLMHSHSTLPMGEFAIGTNTTAYMMAKKYDIIHLLPVLIVEKMGPHFAVGDTCFDWAEDVPVINPLNGKDMIARDNEKTLYRKTDISKAYTNCHTDITIPFSDIAVIEAVSANGKRTTMIEDGRFVLPGTLALNAPMEEKRDE